MTAETPQITAAFIAVSIKVHEVRHNKYIFPRTVALLTCTTESFWDDLRRSGKGPQHHRYQGHDWFLFAEVQQWLLENVCEVAEARDV